MHELSQEFSFDAAHQLGANVDSAEHPYARVHGHSFTVTVTVRGTPDPAKHWIIDLADFKAAVMRVRDRLDHRYLNDIEGLSIPTMETISLWIWQQLKPEIPSLYRVTLRRGTAGEICSYQAD